MHCERKLTEDMYWIGSNDRRLALFENLFPIPGGISYNSYFIDDEKTVLIDTVDMAVSKVFFENLSYLLKGQKLDYLIINHLEPDHSASLGDLIIRYPDVKIICTSKCSAMISQYFTDAVSAGCITANENFILDTGRHKFKFIMAPMVHWPEVMITYDTVDNILYSADAFGTFGAINGNIYADETDYKVSLLADARRYYTNIVGKYGPQVQALLKKAASLDIKLLCPLHGPVWRNDINWLIEKYDKWSSYTPEDNSVMIVYGSVYGNTENAADILAHRLGELGIQNINVYEVSSTHPSYLISEAFRCSHIVFASTTYNTGIFFNMETVLKDLKDHNLQNRITAVIENGSWAPASGKLIREYISSMKNITILDASVSIKSSVKENNREEIYNMADAIYNSMKNI